MGPILFIVFIVVPLLELFVIIQVGQVVGAPATILALLAISLVGAALVRREGLKAWQRFTQALAEGRVPAGEVVDGALLLFGGALLLTPGFLTDALGLALLIPLTRAGLRRLVRRRVHVFAPLASARNARGGGSRKGADRHDRSDRDVDVEVVDVERNETPPRKPEPPPESE